MSAPCLRSLPDKPLIDRLTALVKREHECTIDILHHLNEVERRRLHRDYGYASLFRYCTERLGYSASAASRRIATARAINRYPAVLELLTRREVSLTTVYKVAGVAFKRDDPSLFERIRGKSQGAVDEIACRQCMCANWWKQRAGVRDCWAGRCRQQDRRRRLARAGYRCSFVGVDGVRCTETAHLQIDHISPVALGGSSVPDNLRVLCPAHNTLEAERLLGRDRMARYRT
jgi:hypothetical protein